MPVKSFNNLSTIGLIKDQNPRTLPVEDQPGFAWSDVQNFRFKDGVVEKMNGYEQLIDATSTITPYYTTRISNGSQSFYVYCGLNKIYTYYANSHYNITRQSGAVDVNYSASSSNQWNHCILNGFPIFNNGIDIPQTWNPINQSTRLNNLTNWPTSYKADVIRSYKAYLIALNITDAVPSVNVNKVKWSAAALPGALPTTWDITDPTNDAGEISLSDSEGYLVDCLTLNDYNIIYKSTSTYIMSYVGGNTVFSIRKLFPNVGMLSKNCAAYFEGKHFVVTNDDVIIHDGNTYQSVIDGKNKKYLFNNISADSISRTFVVPNYRNSEMWICFPSGSSTYPNNILIYNYKNQTWSKRLCPETSWISEGFIDIGASSTWASMSSVTWTSDNNPWDKSLYNTKTWDLTMVVPGLNKLMLIDQPGTLFENGANAYCYLERQSLFPTDQQSIKMVKRVWPNITKVAGANTSIDIYLGSEMVPGQVTWYGPYAFNTSTDNKIDCFVTGRNLSIRFSSNTDIIWNISAFDMDIDIKGKW